VRFEFRSFPAASGGLLTPRPIVDVALEGLEAAPIACLLDTGALRTRMSREFAELAGIAVDDAISETVPVGGGRTRCAFARVTLTITDGRDMHSWDAPVWFCDPWPYGFGLLGLEGFLHHFRVTISAYEEYVEVEHESA
jgi:Aspartyl protease